MKFSAFSPLLASLILPGLAPAQGIQSGPKAGMQLTAVPVYAAAGERKGQEFDAAAALGKGPGALLFVKNLTRETAPLIRNLDNLAAEFSLCGFKSFTVMLAADRTAAESRVVTVSRSIASRNPMVVSLDGAEGPGNYAINRDCTLTLVMVKDGVVANSIPFTDTGAKDIPLLRQAIEAVAGKAPKTKAEVTGLLSDDPAKLKKMVGDLWLEVAHLQRQLQKAREANRNRRGKRGGKNRRMRGRGQNPAKTKRQGGRREGKAPDDAELQGLIQVLIQKDNTGEDIDRVFRDIDKRVGQDAGLQKQILERLKLILSLNYGNEAARERAQAYRSKHGQDAKKTTAGKTTSRKTGSEVRKRARKDI